MSQTDNRQKRIRIMLGYLIAAAVLIGFDQWTKHMAVSHLKGQDALVLIRGVFELSYLENTGMAWGLFAGKRIFFLIGSLLVLMLVVYGFYKAPPTRRFRPFRIIMAVLFAGAVGNFIDRFAQGYVVDFLSFCLIDFPIFNVADCYVVTAGIAFILFFLFYYKDDELSVFLPSRQRKKTKAEDQTEHREGESGAEKKCDAIIEEAGSDTENQDGDVPL